MKWQELDVAKLVKVVPGDSKAEKIINAFDIKYGDYDYSDDLRAVSYDELNKLFTSIVDSINIPKTGVKVLIAGSNSGYEVQFFPGCEINAIDLSKRALKKLNDKYPFVHTKMMNINKLEFPDNYFDIYCCLRSIQSYEVDVNRTLEESFRVTKDKGRAVISIPNGYIVDGRVQKGMFDPSRGIYNEELPQIKINEIIKFYKSKGCICEIHETQSEIIVKTSILK